MKILLIYPYFLEDRIHEEEISLPPQGIYYVAAVLKENGYDVDILNWYNIQQTPGAIEEVLRTKTPDIIGFSILHANRWGGIDVAKIAREILPNVKIVFGGIGATYLWNHLLTHFPQIDFVVIGEGETSFLNLVRHIEEQSTANLNEIHGIAYRDDQGQVVRTACDRFEVDLDRLPNPAKYFSYQHLSLTRGCPGNCSFCGSPDFWKRKVRFHSAEYFVDQVEQLRHKGIQHFFFSDDTFTINKKKTIAVCRLILERKLDIVWQAISRVDMVDEEVLCWMRRAGCIQISYGVESGSERIRQYLNKSFTDDQIEEALSLTAHYGIMPRAYFIYGCPGECPDTIRETIELIRRIKPLSAIFYILDIFPGTAIYDEYMKRCRVNDDIWLERMEDLLYFETDPDLTRDQVLDFGKQLRASFYKGLPTFVNELDLVEKRDLYPHHADFLSRLAMTFDHGDYSRIDDIPDKSRIARHLYEKALSYYPDSRAYLGLGIYEQKNGNYEASEKILTKGIARFPNHEQLNICLGVSYMNLEKYAQALDCLLPHQQSGPVLKLIAGCYQALERPDEARRYMEMNNAILSR